MEKERKTIGYVTPFIWGDVSLSYFKGAVAAAKEYDHNLICYIGNRFDDPDNYQYQANLVYDLMEDSWVDGIVMWASHMTEVMEEYDQSSVTDRLPDVPVTSIAGHFGDGASVMGNSDDVMKLLIDHLASHHGYKKIGFIRGRQGHAVAESRYSSFVSEMKAHGLEVEPDYISACYPFKYESGTKAFNELYERLGIDGIKEMDAIISVSDALARTFIEELRRVGIRVPEDLAVVGINNKSDSHMTVPPLTTVDPRHRAIGYKAMEVLNNKLIGEEWSDKYLVDQVLIVRNSCGCTDRVSAYEMEMVDCASAMILEFDDHSQAFFDEIIFEGLRKGDFFGFEAQSSRLASLFTSDIVNLEQDQFLHAVRHGLDRFRDTDEDLSSWKNVVEQLRVAAIRILKNPVQRIRCHDICNAAVSEINQAMSYQFAKYKTLTDQRIFNLNDSTITLRSTFNVDELFDLIEGIMPKMGIPGCHITFFDGDDTSENEQKASVVFAYKGGDRLPIDEDWKGFRASELLPTDLRESDEGSVLFVQALYFREEVIGYIVFEAGPIDKSLYEILAGEISSALYRCRTFQSLVDAENERVVLLNELERKNQDLEKTVKDRTKDLVAVNQRLEVAVEEANRANEAKSRFLANISHEIRTPLNCIIGFSDMIQAASKDETISRYTALTLQETEKLLELINQLLDLSKIEAGKLQLSEEGVELSSLMESLASTYSVVTQNKGLKYSYHIDETAPGVIKGDALRLRQILVNLIGNAVKFTSEGGIKVAVQCIDGCKKLRFTIEDTGIGIEEERLDAIFSKFEQETSDTSRSYGGTGLGTSISKELVELMGGVIGVTSVKGEGSLFWFEIPYEPMIGKELETFLTSIAAGDGKSELTGEENYSDKHVLIVEDYPPNRMLAIAYLSSLGCACSIAVDGQEAIEMIGEHKYDLVLMDVQMPRMDGVEATGIIRSDHRYDDLVVVGMTANAYETDLKNYAAIGMNDVVTKPFRKTTLNNVVSRWLQSDIKSVHTQEVSSDVETVRDQEPLRYDDLLQELDGNAEMMDELVKDFLHFSALQLEDLDRAIEVNDMDATKKIAHTIKGSALNMTADAFGEMAKRLEYDASLAYADNMAVLLEMLRKELESLKTYLMKKHR